MSNMWTYVAQFSLGIWYNIEKKKEEEHGRHRYRK